MSTKVLNWPLDIRTLNSEGSLFLLILFKKLVCLFEFKNFAKAQVWAWRSVWDIRKFIWEIFSKFVFIYHIIYYTNSTLRYGNRDKKWKALCHFEKPYCDYRFRAITKCLLEKSDKHEIEFNQASKRFLKHLRVSIRRFIETNPTFIDC